MGRSMLSNAELRDGALSAANWLIRIYTPQWLQLAGLHRAATALSDAPRVVFPACIYAGALRRLIDTAEMEARIAAGRADIALRRAMEPHFEDWILASSAANIEARDASRIVGGLAVEQAMRAAVNDVRSRRQKSRDALKGAMEADRQADRFSARYGVSENVRHRSLYDQQIAAQRYHEAQETSDMAFAHRGSLSDALHACVSAGYAAGRAVALSGQKDALAATAADLRASFVEHLGEMPRALA